MQTNESKVEEYMNTLSLLQRDKEEVSNVIRGYMLDCQMKDNELMVLTDVSIQLMARSCHQLQLY